jgi:hypothetical protein
MDEKSPQVLLGPFSFVPRTAHCCGHGAAANMSFVYGRHAAKLPMSGWAGGANMRQSDRALKHDPEKREPA